MVPTLRVPKDALRSNGFINGYIKDEKVQHDYEDSIYLLFKPDNVDKFREFLDGEYERTKSIIFRLKDKNFKIQILKDEYYVDFTLTQDGQVGNNFKQDDQLLLPLSCVCLFEKEYNDTC